MTYAMYMSMGLKHDYSEALKLTDAPVLVVHGGKDLQPEEASKLYADLHRNGRLHVIQEATHFAYDETPKQFSDLLYQFLSTIGI